LNYELFSPPYLFRGARPTLTGFTPAVVGYGQTLQLDTPDGASIRKVTFIRNGSVTHAFDQAGRLVPLAFAPVGGGISVTLAASRIWSGGTPKVAAAMRYTSGAGLRRRTRSTDSTCSK